MPCARKLVASLSPRRHELDTGRVFVRFVLEKVTVGQVYLRVLWFYSVSFFQPIFLNHHLSTDLIRKTGVLLLWTLIQSNALQDIWENWAEKVLPLCVSYFRAVIVKEFSYGDSSPFCFLINKFILQNTVIHNTTVQIN